MKYIDYSIITLLMALLTGCSYEPHGRWEATDKIKVRAQRDDPMTIAFHVEKGEVCALSDKWYQEKDLRYKEIICPKGRGWIIDDEHFKKIGD
jgi:hypothetical protein